MIYIIGGPPRCGKTTLAKAMSKKMRIPWISCDTLEVVVGEYMSQADWDTTHPYSVLRRTLKTNDRFYAALKPQKIISVLRAQARATFPAIAMMVLSELTEGNDYIIEGYHIDPSFAVQLIKKHGRKNVRAIFLTKHDPEKFAVDVHKSTTPNDWLILGTKHKHTFVTIGKMVALYSTFFQKEARRNRLPSISMDVQFEKQLKRAIKLLTKTS